MDTYELAKGRMNEFLAEAQRCAIADRFADEQRGARGRRRPGLRFPLTLASLGRLIPGSTGKQARAAARPA